MTERITIKHVRNYFPYFLKAIGKRAATSWKDVGGHILDYHSEYGGIVIVQMEEGGGRYHPFGSTRRTPREMLDAMHFAYDSIEVMKRRG